MRVLIVEDDDALASQIDLQLRQLGLTPLRWSVGRPIHPDYPPDVDLVVLDLMLPEVDGFTVLEQLRSVSDVPVLVLSARDGSDDKVRALRLGADDYLCKPFWPEELRERVLARLRRPVLRRSEVLVLGAISIDRRGHRVTVDGELLSLTPTEHAILLELASRPGHAFTRRALAQAALDPDRDGNERSLDAHLSRLRKKLGNGIIETVWGVGYRLAGPRVEP